ncbi:MAG: FMN-binding protein [Clostridia bacterium]|nr:FMN-binding protein [Clostridia bacterium]
MIKNLKSVIALTVICAVVSVLLALTNQLTAPIIAKQEASAVTEALSVVLPNGEDFQSVDISNHELPKTVTEAYSEKNGGYVFKMTTTGYGSGLVILCGIDKEGTVKGATCISSNETLGYEETYGDSFKDKNAEQVDGVDTISNATMTTSAYKNAVKDALNSFTILNGGSVDLRSEEEILNDNLNSAFPEAQGKFINMFITEDIGEISAVYQAENNTGYVFIIGESFVATDKDGKVTTDTDMKDKIETAAKAVINTKLTEIDITKYKDLPSQVKEVSKTDSGNYVFILHAAGYGINGGNQYHAASGKPIVIKASATKDGKIISCITVEQSETENIGSACADKKFYSQFNGKTESDYSEIDAISGATITTNGYKTAISKIFEAIKIMEGVS